MRYALLAILLITLDSCSMINKKVGLPDDNLIEECAEILLDVETGLNVDLSPSSPEK